MLDHISSQYAKALFELSSDKYELILEQLEIINKIILENEDLRKFLEHPKITIEEKKEVFQKSLVNFEEVVVNFIYVLIDNKRINLLDSIIKLYKELYNEANNIMEFELVSSTPLLDGDIQEIKDILKVKYNKNIIVNVSVSPDFLGGVVVKYKDQVIDDSVLTRIKNIRDFLKNRKLR